MANRFYLALHKIDYALLLAIILPIIGILPTFGDGLANGADAPFHAHRIYALAELIRGGELYPRWVSYFHMGYGYPVFNFYAPLATHIGAWFHLLGFDVVTAYNLTNALVWSIGSVGMYWLARTFLPLRMALVASVLWVYAPSRFFEFWWQGSIAQIVATSFIPFVFYGIIRTVKAPTLKNSLWIAIPFALIVLSHTPTTYMTAIFVAPFCIVAPLCTRSFRAIIHRWLYIGIGLGLSAGLSAIFLIPVFAEVGYVKIAGELPDTIAFLRAGFAPLSEVIRLPLLIDSTDMTLVMPRTLGLVGMVLSGFGVVALILRRRFGLAILLSLGLGFAIFMTLAPSLDLWLLIPSFRNLRFPERILRVGVVFVALLGASSLWLVPSRWRGWIAVLVSLMIVAQALPIMHPRDDDRIWNNLSAVDEIQMEFRENNWGTTAYDEYEPMWGEVTPFDMPHDLETYKDEPFKIRFLESDIVREIKNIQYEHINDNTIRVMIDADDLPVRLRQFYFPGWQVTLDGEPFDFDIDERFGLIEMNIPNGEHIIQLAYVGTPIQHASAVISLMTVLLCALIIWRGRGEHPRIVVDDRAFSSRTLLLFASILIVFAIGNRLWLQSTVFRVQSPPDTPYYMEHLVDQAFEDGVTLLGYSLTSATITPDDPLRIRLYWRVEKPVTTTYRPIVQLINLTLNDSWAVSQPLEFEGGTLDELSPDRFMSDGHQLVLFEDAPAYVGKISVQLGRVTDGRVEIVPLADGQERVMLPELIRVENPSPQYDGQFAQIQLGDAVALQCIGLKVSEEAYQIELWWNVKQLPSIDYKLFVHGLNADGEIVQQVDRFPLDGAYPMSMWQVAQSLNDTFLLPQDDDIIRIVMGLYDPATGVRLPVDNGTEPTDFVNIPFEETTCAP